MAQKLAAGLYEKLITKALGALLNEEHLVGRTEREALDAGDAHILLAHHLHAEILRALASLTDKEDLQLQLANQVLQLVHAHVPELQNDPILSPAEALYAIREPNPRAPTELIEIPRPAIPLGASDLLVNARNEPRVGHALQKEIQSADHIDLLCAFIRWKGVLVLQRELHAHLQERGRTMRILTTTYMGATEQRALDMLANLGAEIRVCYEEKSTRLHAKAWLLKRHTGFSTAFVGSSNLSHSAMMDGMEWNVRLSQVQTPDILEKFGATFEDYWQDDLFRPYRPDDPEAVDALERALRYTRRTDSTDIAYIDVHPYPHQQEILEKLAAERARHHRFKNLVVSATGTGKTMVAAFDFARWYAENPAGSLLFVAHREDILQQSLRTFRTVLRDGSFGELLVGDYKPTQWRHVFASIQSLAARGVDTLAPDAHQFVIVDEFHHSEAPTYTTLLAHLKPQILLGLTATPERGDGQSILHWFDGRIAAEIRLWEALDRQLLAPFQYFGVHDNTDLAHLSWSGGRYNPTALSNLYTGDHARVALILKEIDHKIADPHAMKALGFCVSIDHAEFMAAEFSRAGLQALALTSRSSPEERRTARHRLTSGALQVIFTVDLFNEGVDIPEVDTILFLRPTESPTIFLQQLGRGLRHAHGKSCLTVLDFIGHAHKNFRYDMRFMALTSTTRRQLKDALSQGFPYLPAGCSLQLDRVAENLVLDNIKQALGQTVGSVAAELRQYGDISLGDFLHRAALTPEDIYQTSNWYWTKIRREAGLPTPAPGPDDDEFGGRLHRILHLDAADRLDFYRRLLTHPAPPPATALTPQELQQLYMLHFALWGDSSAARQRWPYADALLQHMWQHPAILQEMRELLALLDDRAPMQTYPLDQEMGWVHQVPLSVHATYQLSEIRAAFGLLTPQNSTTIREGVRYLKQFNTDLFFITLEKTEKHYSPQTMYRDYAISRELFHWESQSTTAVDSPTGQRYIHHGARGTHVLLFVRQHKKIGSQTQPYTLLGPADYVRHEGNRPISITWKLRRPMPTDRFLEAKVLAG